MYLFIYKIVKKCWWDNIYAIYNILLNYSHYKIKLIHKLYINNKSINNFLDIYLIE